MRETRWWFAVLVCLVALAPIAVSAADCDRREPGLSTRYSDGWGITPDANRLQARTTIERSNAGTLQLAWAYGFGSKKPRTFPLVTEDTLFIADSGVGIVALDRETGCTRWVRKQGGELGTAILYARIDDRDALVYNDRNGGVYAIDALTGADIWHAAIVEQPIPMYSGTPTIQGQTVLVPISSLEIGLAANPLYGCCTTSGGMAAFDLQTGKELWFLPTIDKPPAPTEKHWLLVQEYGPSGAPVWGTPTVDVSRGVTYYGSGQNYSPPSTTTSDAIFAVDIASGEKRWVRQFTENDTYNIACDISRQHPNCPVQMGPDHDFGAPPVLVSRPGHPDVLVAGQKSGHVHGLDPETGEVRWSVRLGRGGALGGIHWGMAADANRAVVYVPVSDVAAHPVDGKPAPGLYALDVDTGETLWVHSREDRCPDRICSGGLSAAITATPEVVFAGSLDGYFSAYAADNGELLWTDDTWKDFDTVNGVPASGGAFDAHGPMVADDMVIVSSGYDSFGEKGGNVLLVYRLGGEGAK
ncbi:MAG: PQQ-binding-like beta-propeller repeat protein [Pseudomonadales bacterium]|nr:PQQ-binding-like beta-propeller repeat protein [Pseudomonadales bacterium]